jgi:MFS family permease
MWMSLAVFGLPPETTMSQRNLTDGKNGTHAGIRVELEDGPATLALRPRVEPANDTGPGVAAAAGPLGLSRTFWTLWAGMLLNRMGGTVFFMLGLYLTHERGLPAEVAGLIISLYAAGGLVAGPVGGVLADHIGRRATLLLGTSCAGTLMLALGLARSTVAIAALAPFVGFFTISCVAPLQAAVADVVPPEHRTRAYGLVYWAINLGFSAASICGGALAEHHFTTLFVIDALTTFAYGAVVYFGVPETQPARVAGGGDPRSSASFLEPFRDGPFVKFVLVQALLLVAFAQVITALPLDMRAHGLGLSAIGWLMGLTGVYIVVAQPLALRFVRGRGHAEWLIAGCVLTGLGLGATAFAGGALVYALSAVVWTLGEIGFSTAAPALVAELAPVERRGAYQGTYQLAWGTASVLAPTIGTFVLARLGGRALWGGCLVASLAAAVLHLRLARRRADGESGPPA